jgi:hypothetical protein
MELRNVVLFKGEKKLLAAVAVDGGIREVEYKWFKKPDGIPSKWFEVVKGEVAFQKTEEFKTAQGRPTL